MSTTEIAVFGLGWIVVVALAVFLDWAGNSQRGRFRPAGERTRGRAERQAVRQRWEADRDRRRRAALAASPTWRERRRAARTPTAPAAAMSEDDEAAVRRVLDRLARKEQDRGHGTDDAAPRAHLAPDPDPDRAA